VQLRIIKPRVGRLKDLVVEMGKDFFRWKEEAGDGDINLSPADFEQLWHVKKAPIRRSCWKSFLIVSA